MSTVEGWEGGIASDSSLPPVREESTETALLPATTPPPPLPTPFSPLERVQEEARETPNASPATPRPSGGGGGRGDDGGRAP